MASDYLIIIRILASHNSLWRWLTALFFVSGLWWSRKVEFEIGAGKEDYTQRSRCCWEKISCGAAGPQDWALYCTA